MSTKQGFVGTAVVSVLVGKAVDAAVTRLSQDKSVPLDSRYAKDVIADRVAVEVDEYVKNQTNAEPLYRSRVVLGSVGAAMVAVGSIVQMYFDDRPNDINEYLTHVGVLVPIFYAIYGRVWAAKALGK
jgi:hypothetical protein